MTFYSRNCFKENKFTSKYFENIFTITNSLSYLYNKFIEKSHPYEGLVIIICSAALILVRSLYRIRRVKSLINWQTNTVQGLKTPTLMCISHLS